MTSVETTPLENPPAVAPPESPDASSALSVEMVHQPPGITLALSSASESTTPDEAVFGLRRGDQLFVGVLLTTGLALLAIYLFQLSGWGRRPIEIDRLPAHQYDYRLNINQAPWMEWLQLEGIGETLARRIVADREQHGPFRSVDDLQRVKGIGPKILDRMRPWLEVQAP